MHHMSSEAVFKTEQITRTTLMVGDRKIISSEDPEVSVPELRSKGVAKAERYRTSGRRIKRFVGSVAAITGLATVYNGVFNPVEFGTGDRIFTTVGLGMTALATSLVAMSAAMLESENDQNINAINEMPAATELLFDQD